jgi:hypothetical protein
MTDRTVAFGTEGSWFEYRQRKLFMSLKIPFI